jgi:hypothetical protein
METKPSAPEKNSEVPSQLGVIYNGVMNKFGSWLDQLNNLQKLNNAQLIEKLQKLKEIENLPPLSGYDLQNPAQVQLEILTDESLPPGKFFPLPSSILNPNTQKFKCHPLTYEAMRKDLFFCSEDMDELTKIIICHKCHNELDLQFWLKCPFCGSKIN